MLHTVNKSPYEKNSVDTCLRMAKPGSDVLLIEDAVYAAITGSKIEDELRKAGAQLKLYALGPDLKTRGIAEDRLIDGIQVVGYDGFVELAAKNECVQSWL